MKKGEMLFGHFILLNCPKMQIKIVPAAEWLGRSDLHFVVSIAAVLRLRLNAKKNSYITCTGWTVNTYRRQI